MAAHHLSHASAALSPTHPSSLPCLQCVEALPAKNWLVVAIDEPLQKYCQEKGINHYYKPVVVSEGCADKPRLTSQRPCSGAWPPGR